MAKIMRLLRATVSKFLVFALTITALLPAISTGQGSDDQPDAFKEAFAAYQEERYEEAHRLLLPLAESGAAQAQLALSLLYEKGLGVPQDTEQAISWYEKAALQGDPVIQYELGLKYFNGDAIEVDYDKAATWWLKAAAQEHAGAQYNLALMYIKGKGFSTNMRMAMEWLSKAAVQDYGPAHYSLGVIHATGNGVERSYARAFEHFRAAAPQGIVEAQYNLGVCYEKGRGTAVNLERARQWYQLAAKQGFEKAVAKLAALDTATESAALETKTTRETEHENAKQPDSAKWLGQQFPRHYTLQLIALSSLNSVERFINTYQIPEPNAYYLIKRNERELYRVLYGAFESRDEAAAAREKLQAQHADLAPVIVQFAAIHRQLGN